MSDSAESATPTDAAAAPISAASADDDNLVSPSSAPPVSNNSEVNSDAMSETTGSIENVSATSAAGTSDVSLKSDSILSDSENANNENRVIEMEGATNPAGPESVEAEETCTVKVDEPESCAKSDDKSQSQDKYAEHVSYDEQGEAIYTDPETKYRYKWCKVKNEWIPFDSEHYRWCTESEKWIPKDNPKETEHYRWCEETNQWIPKQQASEQGSVYSSEDGVHHYRDKEGMVHFYDEEKKAWFPKVDDDFMARYQLSYGFGNADEGKESSAKEEEEIPEDSEEEEEPMPEEPPKPQGKKRKAPPEPPKWFELKPEHNTKVYVSNLPLDITEEEFGELMSKCGMVLKDPRTNKLKLKLYRDANGELKGDGLCHYIKIESVELALNILDNYDIRGHKIRVQQAEFQLKGEYNPALKPKVRKREKEKIRKMQEALFDWRPEKMRGERSKHERIVIIKNLFEPELFEREVHLLLEYQGDLREECNKCGTCRRVVLFDRHPEGVAQITMSDPEEADLVVKLMNGRFFGKRKLTAEIWDGRTKFRVAETEADVNKRLGNWEKYLEKEEAAASTEAPKQQQPTENAPATTATPAPPAEVKSTPEKEENGDKPQIAAAATPADDDNNPAGGDGNDAEPPTTTKPQPPPASDDLEVDDDDDNDSSQVETN